MLGETWSDFFISAVTGFLFVSVSVMLVLGSYSGARRLLQTGADGDRTHDAAGTVAGRLAAMHGLILALVYAQELDDYKGVRTNLTEEAVAVADVFNDMARLGGAQVDTVQTDLAEYLKLVVSEEWPRLSRHQGLSANAWQRWDNAYKQILDLSPANDRERYLIGRMRQRIGDVARFRQIRETTSVARYSGLFWAPAIIGLVLLSIPFYVYRPTRSHIVLLSIFGAYSGVILFFIFTFSNPFAAPGKLEPRPFAHLLAGDIGKKLQPPAPQ